jgi:hypothetical protein
MPAGPPNRLALRLDDVGAAQQQIRRQARRYHRHRLREREFALRLNGGVHDRAGRTPQQQCKGGLFSRTSALQRRKLAAYGGQFRLDLTQIKPREYAGVDAFALQVDRLLTSLERTARNFDFGIERAQGEVRSRHLGGNGDAHGIASGFGGEQF